MCGIAGYYSKDGSHAAAQVMLTLYAEQHRGQESCGIASLEEDRIAVHRAMGYVKEAFPEEKIKQISGVAAIGHVRYPTRGSSVLENTQPHIIETLSGPIYAIASNGDLVNYDEIADELRVQGVHFSTNNDGELLGRFIVFHHERKGLDIPDAIRLLMRKIKGAYSAVFMARDVLYAFRDSLGFRPMHIGRVNDDIAFSSESCAMDILRATESREVKPGEIIVVTRTQEFFLNPSEDTMLADMMAKNGQMRRHCIFEMIYFARPDSFQFGEYVYGVRQRIGAKLAENDDIEPDVVVPVPDSANFIALGYANAKKAPYNMGLIRNHYVGRTFIRPDQYMRDESVRQKFNPLRDFFEGKKVVLVDDSVVRGTTVRKIVRMVQGAGAKEVHLRIGSPPVRHSCYYGIDTPTRKELIANNLSIEEIREYVCADSLKFLPIEQLRECVRDSNTFCDACFSGNYPLPKKD